VIFGKGAEVPFAAKQESPPAGKTSKTFLSLPVELI
jgi:hypothetical protein